MKSRRRVEDDAPVSPVSSSPVVKSSSFRKRFYHSEVLGEIPHPRIKRREVEPQIDWEPEQPKVRESYDGEEHAFRKGSSRKKKIRRRPEAVSHGPLVSILKAVGLLGFIAFVSFGFYELLPDYSRETLAITGVNVSLLPEEFRADVSAELSQIIKQTPDLYSFSSLAAEDELSRKFPQIQNLRVSAFSTDRVISVSGKRRESAALVRNSGGYYLVDSTGFVIEQMSLGQLATVDLPHIAGGNNFTLTPGKQSGSDSLKDCLVLLDVIHKDNPNLYKNIQELAYVYRADEETTALVMQLRGGLEVRMDEVCPNEQMWKYDVFERMARDKLNVNPLSEVAYVDLRFKKQIPFMLRATEREKIRVPDWAKPLVNTGASTASLTAIHSKT